MHLGKRAILRGKRWQRRLPKAPSSWMQWSSDKSTHSRKLSRGCSCDPAFLDPFSTGTCGGIRVEWSRKMKNFPPNCRMLMRESGLLTALFRARSQLLRKEQMRLFQKAGACAPPLPLSLFPRCCLHLLPPSLLPLISPLLSSCFLPCFPFSLFTLISLPFSFSLPPPFTSPSLIHSPLDWRWILSAHF